MKYLRFLLASVAVCAAYNAMVLARPLPGFNNVAKRDTLNYRLNISEAQIPLLKDTIFNREKCLITHCPLTLVNNSNDTLKYVVMSVSWWDSYKLDNQIFAFAADWWNVFKNGEVVLELPPHQSTTKSIPIITYKSYYRGQKLRIAMSLKRLGLALPNLERGTLPLRLTTTSLIWSNEVVIQ
jgi:hypothetical protein